MNSVRVQLKSVIINSFNAHNTNYCTILWLVDPSSNSLDICANIQSRLAF